ncbi:MAG: GNAT family N-acetyltransferase [Defluviitaleaceae bacterium]|nr:GNAT family N-acetyltransferase [Defluviitaleaceae bacterium]
MEIRRITPLENIQYDAICHTVFFDMERKNIRKMLKEPEKHADDEQIVWAAFDNLGKMCSAVLVTPVTMQLNGQTVETGVVGGVVTRPESRGLGTVYQIMKKALPSMTSDDKQILSFLYPFSFSYYRKFGYETCYSHNVINIPIGQFRHFDYPNRLEPFEKGDDISPFIDIYNSFSQTRNFSVVRNKNAWKELLNRDPYKNLEFTFLNYDEAGNADAYILYEPEPDGNENHRLIIKELCWKNPSGLQSILGYFYKLGAEFTTVRWNAPNDIDIHALFPEPGEITWHCEASGMARLVDVCGSLSLLASQPHSDGSLTIKVIDKFLQENSGMYRLGWEKGQIACNALKLNDSDLSAPDLETSIETLAQLVTGYITPTEAMYRKDTIIKSGLDQLTALFPKRLLYIMEQY